MLHNVQSLMPRHLISLSQPGEAHFLMGTVLSCIIWIYYYGVLQKAAMSALPFCMFLFRTRFSLPHFLFCVQTSSFKLGLPSTTVKPNHMHHIPKTNTSEKKQRILEKVLDRNILENPHRFFFVLGYEFLFFSLISRFLEHIPSVYLPKCARFI